MGVKKQQRRAPEPAAAPSQKLPLTMISTRPRYLAGEFVNRRIDGGVFASDAEASNATEQCKTQKTPRRGGEDNSGQIDNKSNAEDQSSAKAIGEPAENERPKDRTGYIRRGSTADLFC